MLLLFHQTDGRGRRLAVFFVVLAEFSKNASRAQLSFRVWNCAKQWAVNTCEASKADEDDWIVLIRLHSFCSWNQTAFKGVDVTWCALDKARLCRKPNWHRNLLPRHIDVRRERNCWEKWEKQQQSNSDSWDAILLWTLRCTHWCLSLISLKSQDF